MLRASQVRAPLAGPLTAFLFLACTSASSACAPDRGDCAPCLAGTAEVQAIRDDLEVALTYLKASKDNFGPARGKAIEATGAAIATLEQATGAAIVPADDSRIAKDVGRRGHPRMRRAQIALYDARSTIGRAGCLTQGQADALLAAIVRVDAAIYEAYSYNPRFSSH
jgi:hypothetical protein